MWKWLGLFSLCGLIACGIYLYTYLGFSEPVAITIGESGPFHMLYKEHRGPYHQIGPKIQEVEKWAVLNNVPCSQTFGEYLDDPASVDEDRLRSNGGCMVPSTFTSPPEGFKIKEMKRKKYIIARYSGSPAVGPFTVYPKVKEFVLQNRLKTTSSAIEIYFVSGAKVTTEYLFELP